MALPVLYFLVEMEFGMLVFVEGPREKPLEQGGQPTKLLTRRYEARSGIPGIRARSRPQRWEPSTITTAPFPLHC